MFDTSIFKAELHKVCSVCLTSSITLYYTKEDVSYEELEKALIYYGWLNINNVDDMFWKVFRCENCRDANLKAKGMI